MDLRPQFFKNRLLIDILSLDQKLCLKNIPEKPDHRALDILRFNPFLE